MDIKYNTPASKYTGALQGGYKGDLPPATSEYTRLVKSILNGSEMPVPLSDFLKNIYKLFGGDIDVNPPESRLSELLQYGIYTDRYTITDKTDNSITIHDIETSESKILYFDDKLEAIWADIINDGAVLEMVRFITANNEYFTTADNEYFLVEGKNMANYSSKFEGAEIDKRLTDVENKANKSTVDSQINTINSKIDTKADKSTVDSQISTINSEIDTKADKSDLDGLKFTHLTETEYNSLEIKDSGTVYFAS